MIVKADQRLTGNCQRGVIKRQLLKSASMFALRVLPQFYAVLAPPNRKVCRTTKTPDIDAKIALSKQRLD
jgi:hypothetical protein